MSGKDNAKPGAAPEKHDDPEKAGELDRLQAKLERYKREAEQLGEAMRRKPK